MPGASQKRRLWESYRFHGFTPSPTVNGVFGDRIARVIVLRRLGKKLPAAPAVTCNEPGTTARLGEFETSPAATGASSWMWKSAAFFAGAAAR